jgi:hypothetical protein
MQAQLHKKSSSDAKEVMQRLVSWTRQCLDLQAAQKLPAPVRDYYLAPVRVPSSTPPPLSPFSLFAAPEGFFRSCMCSDCMLYSTFVLSTMAAPDIG